MQKLRVRSTVKGGFFLESDDRDPLVEFGKGYLDKEHRLLRSGRVYFITQYFNEANEVVWKDQAFIDWAQAFSKWLKKHVLVLFRKVGTSALYASPRVLELVEKKELELNPDGARRTNYYILPEDLPPIFDYFKQHGILYIADSVNLDPDRIENNIRHSAADVREGDYGHGILWEKEDLRKLQYQPRRAGGFFWGAAIETR